MPLSARISPHLPYLRRFARALTGSQASGDAIVAAVLERLIADVSKFPDTSSDRVSLYRFFASEFDSIEIESQGAESEIAWERSVAANVTAIPPRERQAFLLVAIEGFTPEETSEILGVSGEEVSTLLQDASRLISQQIATEIMIIEDDSLIALDIEQMVTELGHKVTGIARTHKEATDLYHRTHPKLVLADIQLADGSSGIDAVNEILKTISIPVIFITGLPERLLTGERPEPAFLVTKPFEAGMVKALISQALFFYEQTHTATTA